MGSYPLGVHSLCFTWNEGKPEDVACSFAYDTVDDAVENILLTAGWEQHFFEDSIAKP
jgi:hypothetical protein